MIGKFISLLSGGMRAYKIQDRKRKNRFGIVASSLKEVVKKGKIKLQVCCHHCILL